MKIFPTVSSLNIHITYNKLIIKHKIKNKPSYRQKSSEILEKCNNQIAK